MDCTSSIAFSVAAIVCLIGADASESEREIKIMEKVKPEDARVELPTTMIIFKFQDDYRKFYTLDDFVITILR